MRRHTISTAAALTSLLTLLAVGAAVLVARAVTRPIQELVAASDALARGEMDTRVVVGGAQDELAVLADAFNSMAESVARGRAALEERLRGVLVAVEDVLWSVAPDGSHVLFLNPAAESVFGRPVAAFLADPGLWHAVVHRDDREAVAAARAQVCAGEPLDVEYRIVRPDGDVQWLHDRARLVRGDGGEPVRIDGIATRITERRRTEAALREAEERLRALSQRLMEAQEGERRRMAYELHDEIGQSLTALKMSLKRLEMALPAGGGEGTLAEALAIAEGTLSQVRSMSLDLRPALLDDLGLVPALRWYLDRQAQRTGLSVHLVADEVDGLRPEVATACFRIVQEALTNAIRHARATTVDVELRQEERALHLVVRDGGVGFDVDAAVKGTQHGQSLGLLAMQERAVLVGGEIAIVSSPSEGTEIRARIPLAAA